MEAQDLEGEAGQQALQRRQQEGLRDALAGGRELPLGHAVHGIDVIGALDPVLTPLADQTRRDLLEILDDRYDRKSTILTSQLPVEQWHAYLADPTLADAILDRLVHNSYRINLSGDSMRKRSAKSLTPAASANL